MAFTTVFDVTNPGYGIWQAPAFGLPFVGLGFLMVFAPDLLRRTIPYGDRSLARRIFSWFWLIFAVAWTVIAFAGTLLQYRASANALQTEKFQVVEGPVTDFIPERLSGPKQESFTVDGHRFSYSDYVLTAGFHTSAASGGPIHEGLIVRISYVGNLILKLEIAR